MRVILLTGKGGVGKTSLAVATALKAAQEGKRVFLLSTDAAHSLGDSLNQTVGPHPVEVAPNLVAQEVGVLDELDRSWSDIQEWLRKLLHDETDELIAEELLVFPGMEELVALRAIREVEATGNFDLCVMDCAPTGSTLRMLRFPDVFKMFMEHFFELKRSGARLLRPVVDQFTSNSFIPKEEFFIAVERLYQDIEEVRKILTDTKRTTVRLVMNPTKVVLEETRRSFAYLSLYGVATDAVIVNRELPSEVSGGYFAQWAEREKQELETIESSFPVSILHAPLYPEEVVGTDALLKLSEAVYGDRDPADVFTQSQPIRLSKKGVHTLLAMDLPMVAKEDLDVSLRGEELVITVCEARRFISLPRSIVGRPVTGARLNAGVLEVTFGA